MRLHAPFATISAISAHGRATRWRRRTSRGGRHAHANSSAWVLAELSARWSRRSASWRRYRCRRARRPLADGRSATAPAKAFAYPEDTVGRSGYLRHLVERRSSQRPGAAACRVRHPGRTDRRGVREDGSRRTTRRGRASSIGSVHFATTSAPALSGRPRSWSNRPTDDSPLTPEAQREVERRQQQRSNPPELVDRSQPLRPLHHARSLRFGAAGHLRQRQLHLPVARRRLDHLRDGARHADHSARWTSAHRLGASGSTWAMRAAASRATRWSSRRRTSWATRPAWAATAAGADERRAARRRALHARRAGRTELRGGDHGSEDVQ